MSVKSFPSFQPQPVLVADFLLMSQYIILGQCSLVWNLLWIPSFWCTVHVALPKLPINSFKQVIQSLLPECIYYGNGVPAMFTS